jgi:hypothetical protein
MSEFLRVANRVDRGGCPVGHRMHIAGNDGSQDFGCYSLLLRHGDGELRARATIFRHRRGDPCGKPGEMRKVFIVEDAARFGSPASW